MDDKFTNPEEVKSPTDSLHEVPPTKETPPTVETTASPPNAEESRPMFSSVDLSPVGVGGWLLFFIIGQLVCRPAKLVGDLGNSTIDMAQLAYRFPMTALLIQIERVLGVSLMVFGIIVAVTLLRTHDRRPVMFAKMYLIANIAAALVLAVVSLTTDLPEPNRTSVISQQFLGFALTFVICSIWFLYFTRSSRVRRTYLEPKFGAFS